MVRLPAQDPPPDEASFSSAMVKILREAQSLQKTMVRGSCLIARGCIAYCFGQHDSFIAQDHLLLALIKDSGISAALKEAGLTVAALKTAIEQSRGNRRVDSRNAEEGFDALHKSVLRALFSF